MSLKAKPIMLLYNNPTAAIIQDDISGKKSIAGFLLDPANTTLSCVQRCQGLAVPQVTSVKVQIPDTCECNDVWGLQIQQIRDGKLAVEDYFQVNRLRDYEYWDQFGEDLVAADVAAFIVNQINTDPLAYVTAAIDGGDPETIIITSKDANTGFKVFWRPLSKGIITELVPQTSQRWTDDDVFQQFPIKPADFGERPNLANCGEYCLIYINLVDCCGDGLMGVNPVGLANVQRDLELWVNKTAPGYDAFIAALNAAVPACVDPCASISARSLDITYDNAAGEWWTTGTGGIPTAGFTIKNTVVYNNDDVVWAIDTFDPLDFPTLASKATYDAPENFRAQICLTRDTDGLECFLEVDVTAVSV
jgi:hypothetical protein